MKIDLCLSPNEVKESSISSSGVIVIDIFRAGTTICQAIFNGCGRIIPVATIQKAQELARISSNETLLLCGEREGKIIPGFDLGNSPFEYTREKISGKSLVMTTTNGTVALDRSRSAHEAVVGGFVNFSVILERVIHWDTDVTIICSGNELTLSLEDTVAGGMYVTHLRKKMHNEVQVSDSARAAEIVYHSFKDSLTDSLRTTKHAQYLQSINFGDDVHFCAQVDSIPVVPVFEDGSIIMGRKNR